MSARLISSMIPIAILAAAWALVSAVGLIPQGLLPSPGAVIAALIELLGDPVVITNCAMSLYRGVVGLGLAIIVGMSAGVLMASFKPIQLVMNPLLQILYPMPKSALLPLMMMWFGLGDMSKIVYIFIGCLLPMVLSSYNGARGVNERLIWSAASFGASRLTIIRQVIIPAAMPEILAGIRMAIGFAFLFIVTSEFLIATNGVGYLISAFGDGGAYPAMFALIFFISLLGFLADQVYLAFMRRALRWRET